MPDPRDPLVETAESIMRAREHQRRHRAEFLEVMLVTDPVGFDFHFRDYYQDDDAILFILSDAAASRGLTLLTPREVQ